VLLYRIDYPTLAFPLPDTHETVATRHLIWRDQKRLLTVVFLPQIEREQGDLSRLEVLVMSKVELHKQRTGCISRDVLRLNSASGYQ